jgi:hypothetical protein
MATAYSKAERDTLLYILEEAVPPIPIDAAKATRAPIIGDSRTEPDPR